MIPYRCLVHSVRTNPSGHFLLMIGPSSPNIIKGSDDAMAYITNPWTPAIVEISGYENNIPEPKAVQSTLNAEVSITVNIVARSGEKRQHISHASINLIEYYGQISASCRLRVYTSLSYFQRRVGYAQFNAQSAPVVKPHGCYAGPLPSCLTLPARALRRDRSEPAVEPVLICVGHEPDHDHRLDNIQ